MGITLFLSYTRDDWIVAFIVAVIVGIPIALIIDLALRAYRRPKDRDREVS